MKTAYFISTISSPLDRQVCKVDLLNGELNVLTSGAGFHSAKVSFSGKYLIDEYSTLQIPREINLIQSDGKKIKTLLHAADPLKDYKLANMDIFTIKAADQKTLRCGGQKRATSAGTRSSSWALIHSR